MYCKKCGHPVPEGTKFCSKCGAAQNIPEADKKPASSAAHTAPAKTAKPKNKKKWILGIAIASVAIIAAIVIIPSVLPEKEAIDDTTVNESIEQVENNNTESSVNDSEEKYTPYANTKEEKEAEKCGETLSTNEIAEIMGCKDLYESIDTDMFTVFDVVDAWAVENGYEEMALFNFQQNKDGIEIPYSRYYFNVDNPPTVLSVAINYDYPNNNFIIEYGIDDNNDLYTYQYTTDEIPNAEQAIEEALEMHANR